MRTAAAAAAAAWAALLVKCLRCLGLRGSPQVRSAALLGVVGLVTPWNYPLMQAVLKVAPGTQSNPPTSLVPYAEEPL